MKGDDVKGDGVRGDDVRGGWCEGMIHTSLQVLCEYAEILDLKKMYTNNIHSMAATYGVEAACRTIVKVTLHASYTHIAIGPAFVVGRGHAPRWSGMPAAGARYGWYEVV